jgi:microcystin-dependent protein
MEEKKDSVASNAVGSSTGVTTSDLKARFSAGSIPLDTDFGKLIDIAECGRRAIGQSADQTNNSVGVGLQLAGDGDSAHKGKLSVKAGRGLGVDANGVLLQQNGSASGLDVSSAGTKVKVGPGLGLGNEGVHVTIGEGLKVDSSGVRLDIDLVLPMGMIVMINCSKESDIPKGWVLCDGRQVTMRTGNTWTTPDLRDRFVIGGAPADLGRTGGAAWKWDDGEKKTSGGFSATSESKPTGCQVDPFSITKVQLPRHEHVIARHDSQNVYQNFQWINVEKRSKESKSDLTALSDQNVHSYQNYEIRSPSYPQENVKPKLSDPSHAHEVPIKPPFYVMAFIMKT